MKGTERVLFTVTCSVLLLACQGNSDVPSAVGTNTNWLRSCDEDAECDAEDACLCSRCTRWCVDDSECPEGAICVGESAARLQCSGVATQTCQPGCREDSDCSEGRFCHLGSCVDGGSAPGCPPTALVCENFESQLGGDLPVVTEENTLQRVETPSPSGRFALQAGVAAAPSVAYLRSDVSPLSNGMLYLSGWFRLPDEPEHDFAPLGFWTPLEEDWALRTVVRNGQLEIWTNTDAHAGPSPVLSGGWHCLEMAVVIGDEGEGSVELFLNGESALSVASLDTLPTGGIESIAAGALWAGTQGTILVDRIIASNEAVGCYGE